MSRLLKQADEYLPTKIMLIFGAFRTYASRLNFFLGVPNTFMIAVLFYDDSNLIKIIFPTVYHWVFFIGLIFVPLVILFDRKVLHPAQITYNAHQASKTNRNPVYKEVLEIKEIVENDE